jgi:hypothetical protein
MSIFYVNNNKIFLEKFKMPENIIEGNKQISNLKKEIRSNTDFCRDEESITTTDLISYLGNKDVIIFYLLHNDLLCGVLIFEIKENTIYIQGLCTPTNKIKAGTTLINAVKNFAKNNKIKQIDLDCYGTVCKFYNKNNFQIKNQETIRDSDSNEILKSCMTFTVKSKSSGGMNKSKSKSKKYKNMKNLKKRKHNTIKHF